MIALKPNEIHLRFAIPDEIRDPRLLSAYKQLMIHEERNKQEIEIRQKYF